MHKIFTQNVTVLARLSGAFLAFFPPGQGAVLWDG